MTGPTRFFLRILAVLVVIGLSGPSPAHSEEVRRTLLTLLDAIPFATVEDITHPSHGDKALFPDLKGPIPIVSTFPSGTNVEIPGFLMSDRADWNPPRSARFNTALRPFLDSRPLVREGAVHRR